MITKKYRGSLAKCRDGGFYSRKLQGLFNKNRSERVRVNLDRWIEIGRCRSDGRGKEMPVRSAVSSDGGAMAEGGWRAWNMAYGPRIHKPKTPGERGDDGEVG